MSKWSKDHFIVKLYSKPKFKELSTQTDSLAITEGNLEEKLAQIEKRHQFEKIRSKDKCFEEKLLAYQREYEQKQKAELETEIQRLKASWYD